MNRSKVCLCLSGETLEEDMRLLEKYRKYIDMVELRADYLTSDEQLSIRRFPEMAGLPCLLTIRRTIDGGKYEGGEATRTTLFARALAFASQDVSKNFAYVDFEEDFNVSSLQDAALAFGTRIIRSFHSMNGPVKNIAERMEKMRVTGYEIPKIACMPRSLSDVTDVFRQAEKIGDFEHILVAMSQYGLPTRILSTKLNSFLTYVSPEETSEKMPVLAHLDPVTLNEMYNFRMIDKATRVFGITGYPLEATSSPKIHNAWYKKNGLNAVFIPIKAETIEEALEFAEVVNIEGMSVTVPHKETVMDCLASISADIGEINACNTVVRKGLDWSGFNTDAIGFKRAICEFMGTDSLAHKKVAIIGAGGAAKAVAYVVKQLRGKACIFNRTLTRAKQIADYYNFKCAILGEDSTELLAEYSDLIVQCTSMGLAVSEEDFDKPENNPLDFYEFTGREAVYDVIYSPAKTPVLAKAEAAGCKIMNGQTMLEYQAIKQFEYFTGLKIEG